MPGNEEDQESEHGRESEADMDDYSPGQDKQGSQVPCEHEGKDDDELGPSTRSDDELEYANVHGLSGLLKVCLF